MFDLRLPDSLADLPGRRVNLCWDEDEIPEKVLPTKQTREERLAKRRAYEKERYERDKEKRNAAAMARYYARTAEQDALLKARRARFWSRNRERINAARRKA